MSKAILIVDISDELLKEYKDFAVEYYLIATSKEDPLWRDCVRFVGETEIKPMPRKRLVLLGDEDKTNVGYNKCLNEITGEVE